MRVLRIPTDPRDVTPELLADIIANVRKLCNLSGSGCTVTELPNGIAINVQFPPKKRRGRLREDLYGCDSATAVVLSVDPSENVSQGGSFTVYDPLNKTAASLLAVPDEGGTLYIPSATCFEASWHDDSAQWEIDEFGQCCPQDVFSGSGHLPPPECGVPCPPAGCAMRWVPLDDGSGCSILVCCPTSGASPAAMCVRDAGGVAGSAVASALGTYRLASPANGSDVHGDSYTNCWTNGAGWWVYTAAATGYTYLANQSPAASVPPDDLHSFWVKLPAGWEQGGNVEGIPIWEPC